MGYLQVLKLLNTEEAGESLRDFLLIMILVIDTEGEDSRLCNKKINPRIIHNALFQGEIIAEEYKYIVDVDINNASFSLLYTKFSKVMFKLRSIFIFKGKTI